MPRGKIPLTEHGFKDASIDPEIIKAWWKKWPDANVGIATGAVSQLWVLDVDGEDGEASLRAHEKVNGALPNTAQIITGGGGRHLYHSWPLQEGIASSIGKLGAGLDVRGNGGYVVAPPSIHVSGKKYERSVDSGDQILPAPAWLLALIQQPVGQKKAPSSSEWAELLRTGVDEGQRNDTMAKIAGKLLRENIPPHLALELCHTVNEARFLPPLPSTEVITIINSIAGRELTRRGA